MRPTDRDIRERRFTAGDRFDFDGAMFRVVEGKKSDDDLRLDMYLGTRLPNGEYVGNWVPVKASWLFLQFDFLWENEHVLYPPSSGAAGGEKLVKALRQAQREGWRAALATLNSERVSAARKRGAA
jgi:hypothetical protein